MPCRQTLTYRLIPGIAEELKNDIKTEFSNSNSCTSICVTTDLWSTPSSESFMGVTTHYVDRDLMLRHWTIALRYMEDSHTAEHLYRHLNDILEEFGIETKTKFACTDTAANIKKAIGYFGTRNVQWLPCSCHLLNLVVQGVLERGDGDNIISSLVAKVRRFVTSFRHSSFLQKQLKDKQLAVNSQFRIKLVQDVCTRWNSVYDMIHALNLNKSALESLINDRNLQRQNKTIETITRNFPSQSEFMIISDLLNLLRPLKELTLEFSAYKYTNCSILFPTIYGLVNGYDFELNTSEVRMAAEHLLGSLRERFNYLLNGEHTDLFLSITFLDYRFKNLEFIINKEDRNQYKLKVKNFLMQHYINRIASEPASEPTTSLAASTQQVQRDLLSTSNRFIFKFFDKNDSKESPLNETSKFEDEWVKYNNLYTADLYADPLEYYRNNKKTFPIFTEIVKYLYCIVGSSVPSECLFSHAEQTTTSLRNRLGAFNLECVTLIKDNL